MSIRTRLWLIGMLMLLIVAVLSGILLWQVWRDLQRDQREIQGVEQIQVISEILRFLPVHRGWVNASLSGQPGKEAEIQSLAAQVDTRMGFLRLLSDDGVLDARQVEELAQEWGAIKRGWRSMTAADSFYRHSRLIDQIQKQARRVGDQSGLTNDPDEGIYYLSTLLARELPQLAETTGRVRGMGAGLAAKGSISAGESAVFGHMRDMLREQMVRVLDAHRALQAIPAVRLGAGDLNGALVSLRDDTQAFMGEAEWLLAIGAKGADTEAWFQSGSRVIDSAMNLTGVAGAEIQHRLKARMAQTRQWGATLLGAALAMLAALFFLLHAVIRRITAPLCRVMDVVEEVGRGNLTARVGLSGSDEVGRLARGVDEMAVKLVQHGAALQREHDQLAESEARFRSLFESSPDAAWIMENHHFSACNPAAVAMFGFPDEAAFARIHPAQISPALQPDGEASFAKAERMMNLVQENGMHRFEWTHQRANGETFPAEVTLTRIELQHRPAIYVEVRDITEQKAMEAERMLLLAQSANQTKLATLGEMATGMMHEINQPLTYISAMIQTQRRAQRKGIPLPEERLAEMLMQSMQQIDRIGKILNHLRAFGRTYAADIQAAVDWGLVLDNALLFMGGKLADAGIELVRDIADPLPRVMGNENTYEQLLVNLLQNAMQALAGREDGRIEIAMRVGRGDLWSPPACGRPQVAPTPDSNSLSTLGPILEIRLSDNGVGMSPEVRDKCFEPFYTTRGTGQGTGIGLSLAHGIVTQHGGTIAVESEPGVGTTFILRFPVLAAA